MNDADFELIMAYADGETGPEETARAEALLAEKSEARTALARLRTVDDNVKASLRGVLDEPIPERLIRAVMADTPAWGRLLRFPLGRRIAPPHWALAASLVLALGTVFWLETPGSDREVMQTFVYQTLEQTPSGERRTDLDRDWQVMPLASYQTADGRLCREYAARTGKDTLSGLACRTADHEWKTLVTETQAVATGYQPASGPAGTVAAALASLQAGQPLTAEEEATRLRQLDR